MSEELIDGAAEALENPESVWTGAADTFPVGTVLPYFPYKTIQLPPGWYVAGGQTVRDPASPFDGREIPNLIDQRFPMGTVDMATFGHYGGTNEIPADGAHSHGGQTAPGGGARGADNGGNFDAATPGHIHGIGSDGSHKHGGENRPNWFGLVYIIKIK